MRSLRDSLFPRLWRATSSDGRTAYEVTTRGADWVSPPVLGMHLEQVSYRSGSYWRWWLTHGRFSFLDIVAILIIIRVLQMTV